MKSKIVINRLNIKIAYFYFINILVINVNTLFRNILDNFKLHIYKFNILPINLVAIYLFARIYQLLIFLFKSKYF